MNDSLVQNLLKTTKCFGQGEKTCGSASLLISKCITDVILNQSGELCIAYSSPQHKDHHTVHMSISPCCVNVLVTAVCMSISPHCVCCPHHRTVISVSPHAPYLCHSILSTITTVTNLKQNKVIANSLSIICTLYRSRLYSAICCITK